jgi:muramoyltetrapeptide carboxypeptidase
VTPPSANPGALPVRRPPPCRPGDRVGVAALSGPVRPERLEAGLAALRDLGFTPVPAPNLLFRDRFGLHAGSDDERLDGFHHLVADPSIRAVLFARGGHGLLRLLPRLDWDLLAETPRVYMGYSDLTPLLSEVVHRLGLAAFHGPMVAADLARGLDAAETASFLAELAGDGPRELPLAGGTGPVVEGPLAGGCLSLLNDTVGTDTPPRLDGSVVFWEDVAEPLYRLDRMLTHLALSHKLRAVSGMVVGHLGPAPPGQVLPEDPASWITDAVMPGGDAPGGGSVIPGGVALRSLAWGLPAGHQAPNLTLPLGLGARLDPAARRLTVGLD